MNTNVQYITGDHKQNVRTHKHTLSNHTETNAVKAGRICCFDISPTIISNHEKIEIITGQNVFYWVNIC